MKKWMALFLLFCLLPCAAMATATVENPFVVTDGTEGVDWSWDGSAAIGVLTIRESGITVSSAASGAVTTGRIVLENGVSVTLDGVKINMTDRIDEVEGHAAVFAKGNGTVTLAGENELRGGEYRGGLEHGANGSLTIKGTGSLKAWGGTNLAAGIGNYRGTSGANVKIEGGTITAHGAYGGAGIGGYALCSARVEITGGTVTAMGGYNSAGIGSGGYPDVVDALKNTVGTVIISGGTIVAEGSVGGAGIGGCEKGKGDVTITGGTITATGAYGAGIGGGSGGVGVVRISGTANILSASSVWGTGIGGGYNASGDVTITGGTIVEAKSTDHGEYLGYSAGIGSGIYGNGTVTITGGTIGLVQGGAYSAGIGGGYGGGYGSGKVTISGGTIGLAQGGAYGAGIGGGYQGKGEVAISGGTITAQGGSSAPGIGGGYDGASTVTITGGNVKAAGTQPVGGTPTNGTEEVEEHIILISGMDKDEPVKAVKGVSGYSLKDVKTLEGGALHFYLPKDAEITGVTAGEDETEYVGGSSADGEEYFVEPGTAMTVVLDMIGEGEALDISEELLKTAFDTTEKIEQELLVRITAKGGSDEDVRLYDAKLMFYDAGSGKWVEANEHQFPENGRVEIVLKLEKGLDAREYDFVVAHMFTKNAFGRKAGDVELPPVEVVYLEEDSVWALRFEVTGLSPIMVSVTKKSVPYLPETGDPSSLLGWVCLLAASGAGMKLRGKKR